MQWWHRLRCGIRQAKGSKRELKACAHLFIFRFEIEEDIPQEVTDKLLKIPHFIQVYDPFGLALEQLIDSPHGASVVVQHVI